MGTLALISTSTGCPVAYFKLQQMAAIESDALFESKDAYTKRLGNLADFGSNIIFKLCHRVRICFVKHRMLSIPIRKSNKGLKLVI